jgi:hypothetical protein
MHTTVRHRIVLWALPLIGGACAPEGTITTDHTMRLQTSPFEARLALEGPIEISMQVPSVTYDGTYISEEQYKWLEEGETTGEWVIAALGEPDFKSTLSDGSEIWRWSFRPTAAQGNLFKLIGKSDEPEPSNINVLVHVRDGVVIDARRG